MMYQQFIHRLSQEIVDEIVDHLSHSKQDLDACSKANRIFLHRCQKHLFSVIYFSSDRCNWPRSRHSPRTERFKKLLEIFQRSPHIARYVRGLHLDISSSDNDWVAEDPDFIRIMETIKQSGSNIRELRLRGLEFPEKLADARSLEQNFLLPFISTSLATLHLSYMVDVPMSLIANSPSIKHLSLHYSALEYFGEYVDKELINALPKIQTLEFRPPDAIIGSIIGPESFGDTSAEGFTDTVQSIITYSGIGTPTIADITSLKTFKSFIEPKHLVIVQMIIQKAKDSLEELYLCEDSEEGEYKGFISSLHNFHSNGNH
ncbi:hypothetical protein CVT25_008887 [Psilocybe cyanescens]|uniref:F-box domain-containing protein n=1 Tax=Psilocybe cyanescens TaxID=93625 RepID=A0A409VRG4_PSICY|nr:hypothetical protein CVT25_008887 [Psilocybe cyanescens]